VSQDRGRTAQSPLNHVVFSLSRSYFHQLLLKELEVAESEGAEDGVAPKVEQKKKSAAQLIAALLCCRLRSSLHSPDLSNLKKKSESEREMARWAKGRPASRL